jgi:predicted MPP superfamily phosphohydrolase
MPLQAAIVTWVIPSIAAILVAWAVQKKGGINKLLPSKNKSHHQSLLTNNNHHQHATFVIGDLHGDVECAKYWVERTGLIQGDNNKWVDETSHLVFLGDYVDKGPQSKQVVEFVMSLTEAFPNQVTAIMGNHEIELLLDRDESRWETWGGVGYFGLAYSSVHPGEYLNYLLEPVTKEDEFIVEVLYNASAQVYARRMHQQLKLASPEQVGLEKSALQFIEDETVRTQVANRLKEYQKTYIDAYRSGTAMGDWLEKRPIVAQVNDTIFIHGGISNYGSALLKQVGVNESNQMFFEHSHQDKIVAFITGTQVGQIMYDMLTFRGNHKIQEGACDALDQLLPEGVTRLGVGHTPDMDVRLLCDGHFLALDSSLGRWFRNSGNLYCHGQYPVLMDVAKSDGQQYLICDQKNEQCEGQIIRLTHGKDGTAEIIR